jgi:cobalamin biosynthesis Mg chelatase CobN
MKKLRGPGRLAIPLLVGAIALLLITPAGATAEGTETSGETATTTESPPPSTGWVPQGGASEGSSGGSGGTQQGSSLGSGGSASQPAPKPTPPPSEPSVSTPPPAPEPSSGSYESESAPQQEPREPVATPAPEPEPAPVKPAPEPPAPVDTHVSLGKADAVLTGSSGVKGVSTASATVAASTTAEVATGSGGLPWIALIVFGLILVVAGARLVYGPIEADSLRYSRFKLVRRAAPRG